MYQIMYAEMAVLGTIRTSDHLQELQAINPTFYSFPKIYDLYVDYHEKHGVIPPPDVIAGLLPDNWDPPEGEFEHWLREYIKSYMMTRAEFSVRELLAKMEEDPGGAVNRHVEELQSLGFQAGVQAVSTDSSITERYQRYLTRVEAFGNGTVRLAGIPSGLDIIDDTKEGWMPGELIGLIARPTVGKTWMLLREGAIAWMTGRKVLLISPEMPANHLALRVDAILAHYLRIQLSHSKIKMGDPAFRQNYDALRAKVGTSDRWRTVESVNGRQPRISDIAALWRRYQPDLILIDGISLLDDERGANSSWEKMKNICYDLKGFATYAKVAIIAAHQAVNSRRGQRGNTDAALGRGDDWALPTLNDAAFGDAFVQAMSTVITMAPDRDNEFIRWYSVRKSRDRDVEWKPRMALAWDVDHGMIDDLGEHGDDEVAIESALRAKGLMR